ncbi:MAG: D-tyrosyl-tRNA(Tyr) deacylase [Bifidobacteriaceae bacterium]|jgi:D-tyrosyl-tRNA(Tyr) deacylase|nr:D-tyrosyl-tRNA(Tyr) deacylase [Bifidobacteriaceae bacterium]
MKALIQRVSQAKVSVDQKIVGQIAIGYVVLLGVGPNDTEKEADFLANKIVNLRILEDSDGKMNLSLKNIKGSILSISQFTLFADTRKGNRPSFLNAAPPKQAHRLYDHFNQTLRDLGIEVETGVFGAHMIIDFIADGPVTISFDTDS